MDRTKDWQIAIHTFHSFEIHHLLYNEGTVSRGSLLGIRTGRMVLPHGHKKKIAVNLMSWSLSFQPLRMHYVQE